MGWLKKIKKKIAWWLVKDLLESGVPVVKVTDKLIVGDPSKLNPDGTLTLQPLTADPTLEAGKIWYRSDIDKWRYSPDGASVKDVSVQVQPDGVKVCTDASGNLTICAGGVGQNEIAPDAVSASKIIGVGKAVQVQGLCYFADTTPVSIASLTLSSASAVLIFIKVLRLGVSSSTTVSPSCPNTTLASQCTTGSYQAFIEVVRGASTIYSLASTATDPLNTGPGEVSDQAYVIDRVSGTNTYSVQVYKNLADCNAYVEYELYMVPL